MDKYYIPNESASDCPYCYYFLVEVMEGEYKGFKDIWINADSLEEATALVNIATDDARIQTGALSTTQDNAAIAGCENNYIAFCPNDATESYPFLKPV